MTIRTQNVSGDLPAGGDYDSFRSDPVAFLRQIARQRGDIARFRLGRRTLVLLAHPEAIREVLVTRARQFVKGPGLLRARPLLGDGLLTADGDEHTADRRALLPAFSTTAALREYAPIMAEAIRQTVQSWTLGEQVDLTCEMAALTLRIASLCFFGVAPEDPARVRDAIDVAIRAAYAPLLAGAGRVAPGDRRRAVDDLRAAASPAPAGCPAHASPAAQALEKIPASRRLDHALTLMIAGHESLAIALSWTWLLVDRSPGARAKLEAEARAIPADAFLDPYALSQKLPYARAVLAEALRLYPPAWMMSRRAAGAASLENLPTAPSDIVVVAPCVTHVDPRWFADPLAFLPERWIDRPRPPRNAYFPFGSGPRLCIGEPFAWMEGVLALALIARSRRLAIDPDFAPEWSPMVTLRPRNPMRASIEAAEAP